MGWISVNEKLPEVKEFYNTHGAELSSDYVLVSVTGLKNGFKHDMVTIGRYRDIFGWKLLHGNLYGKIVAWQPLPDPYIMRKKTDMR